jgi:hypothetical protein
MPTDPTDQDFSYDLALDEFRWRSAALEAIGDDWDPVVALTVEEQSYGMLYSNLDAEQQRHYDTLVDAGVLPDRAAGRASD